MASLGDFVRRISKRAEKVETNVNRVVREMALAVDSTVVLSTPVDTGRARANWLASLGAAITEPIEAEDKSGGATIANARGVIDQRRQDQDIVISNNVPYIQRLNDGWSAQAPAGFVDKAVLAGIRSLQGKSIVKD